MLAAGQNKPVTEFTEQLDVSKEDRDTGHYALPLSFQSKRHQSPEVESNELHLLALL